MSAPAVGVVAAVAAVTASPALWSGLVEQQLPLEVVLTRLALAFAVAWVGLAVVGRLVGEPGAAAGPRPRPAGGEQQEADPPPRDADPLVA